MVFIASGLNDGNVSKLRMLDDYGNVVSVNGL
jgi:hypothetical protein